MEFTLQINFIITNYAVKVPSFYYFSGTYLYLNRFSAISWVMQIRGYSNNQIDKGLNWILSKHIWIQNGAFNWFILVNGPWKCFRNPIAYEVLLNIKHEIIEIECFKMCHVMIYFSLRIPKIFLKAMIFSLGINFIIFNNVTEYDNTWSHQT